MKRHFSLIVKGGLIIFIIVFQLSSCKKETVITPVLACDLRGIYTGTATSSTGTTITETYTLKDNNFAVGSITPEGASITFGGYRNTCDSVIISAYYAGNNSYYLLQGKLSNSRTTISGSFKNITTPSDFGTFSLSK